ncbi:MAG: HlyD family efflux transporter periplasmic adaptor subunit [Pirellulaceae bacterium]
MSIDPASSHDQTKFRTDEIPLHRAATPRGSLDQPDPDLVDQTKNHIRTLVQEISDLAKSTCSEEDFYQGFLTKTTSALASVGGVIWTRDDDSSPLGLLYHINLKLTPLATDTAAQIKHSRLLEQILSRAQPTIVPPNSGGGDEEEAGNPTNFLLLFGPLVVDGHAVGLVEIIQRPGGGPATQRGYLRFLSQMCEIASDYLKNKRLRAFREQQQLWSDLDQFSRSVHQSLDTQLTAFTIANDGRRIIGCDRLSVAIRDGARFQVVAVSGLDTIERRADQIKRLAQLAGTVSRSRERLWFTGDDSKLAPQIESQLHAYVDTAHAKFVGILPLFDDSDIENKKRQPVAALILEQLSGSQVSSQLESRATLVGEHAQAALANALAHNSIFLMPLWKKLAWLSTPFRSAQLPKTMVAMAVAFALVATMVLMPYPFSLGTAGEMIAETQQEIFAEVDGKFVEICVPDDLNQIVEEGTVLARMTNNDLAREIEKLRGEISELDKIIEKLNRQSTLASKLSEEEELDILAQLDKAKLERDFKKKELALRLDDYKKLEIKSPIRGNIVNWQVRRNLLGRPVRVGQNLMTIVSPDTHWQLELLVPEKRMGHLIAAQKESKEPLTVAFTLASNPGSQFRGRIVKIDPLLDVHKDQENTARVLVDFPNEQVPRELLRSGTKATAKIECGTRSLGYVLLHELYETTKTSVLFWF